MNGQVLQITFEMLAGFVAFIVVVLGVPLTVCLWKISNGIEKVRAELVYIGRDNDKRDRRLDEHDGRITEVRERLLRGPTPNPSAAEGKHR